MGAGARRRAARRLESEAAEGREAARFWEQMAREWAGPQRGRTAEADSDAAWAREMARAAYRGAELREQAVPSLRLLHRLTRVQVDVDRKIADCVTRLREAGYSWAQIGAELGISDEGARKRYAKLVKTDVRADG